MEVHSANELHIKVCSDQECTVTICIYFEIAIDGNNLRHCVIGIDRKV